jgi:hypothetical protein
MNYPREDTSQTNTVHTCRDGISPLLQVAVSRQFLVAWPVKLHACVGLTGSWRQPGMLFYFLL